MMKELTLYFQGFTKDGEAPFKRSYLSYLPRGARIELGIRAEVAARKKLAIPNILPIDDLLKPKVLI